MKLAACPDCGNGFGLFRWRWQCVTCSATRCARCLSKGTVASSLRRMELLIADSDGVDAERWRTFVDGDHCRPCYTTHVAPVFKRFADAESRWFEVETWPDTPRDPNGDSTVVASGTHESRGAALCELQLLAAYAGMEIVIDVGYTKNRREVVWYVQRGNRSQPPVSVGDGVARHWGRYNSGES